MRGNPLTVAKSWGAYAAFRRLPEIVLLDEPEACGTILGNWALTGAFPI